MVMEAVPYLVAGSDRDSEPLTTRPDQSTQENLLYVLGSGMLSIADSPLSRDYFRLLEDDTMPVRHGLIYTFFF
jgi:hypothetical protein